MYVPSTKAKLSTGEKFHLALLGHLIITAMLFLLDGPCPGKDKGLPPPIIRCCLIYRLSGISNNKTTHALSVQLNEEGGGEEKTIEIEAGTSRRHLNLSSRSLRSQQHPQSERGTRVSLRHAEVQAGQEG